MVKPLHLILCLNLNRLKRMNCHRCHHRHQNWPETLNSKLLLVTSSTCFGHVGLNSCHEGIDSPLCCNITKINVNHGSWIDHNWHISRVCTQLNKHTHNHTHTHINTKLTHWMLFVCLDSLRFLVLKPSSLHLPISKDDEVINYYEIHHTTHTAQSQQLHPRNWDSLTGTASDRPARSSETAAARSGATSRWTSTTSSGERLGVRSQWRGARGNKHLFIFFVC